MRTQQAIDEYLASLVAEGRSPRTIDAYRRDLRKLVAYMGADFDVREITPRHMLAFASTDLVLLKADGTPRHQGTVNRLRTAVRGLFGFLVRSWAIRADPAQVLRVKATRPARPGLLSAGDEAKLLAVIGADDSWAARRDRLIVRLLLATGLRLSSLCWLDLEDIDAANEQLHVKLKGGRRMVIGLPAELGADLVAHARGQSGPLFRSRRGDRLSARQVQTRFAQWVQAAGVGRVTLHVLRHTYGTRLYRETRDLRRVQVALGHRSVETTERYVAV